MPRKKRCADSSSAYSDCEDDFDVEDDPLLGDYPDSRRQVDSSSPPQRNAANARERARMRVLSRAFCRLKTTLPWVPADTKLSKLDTLRLATSYIAYLREVITDDDQAQSDKSVVMSVAGKDCRNEGGVGGRKHPLSLSWPFSFNHTSSATSDSSSALSEIALPHQDVASQITAPLQAPWSSFSTTHGHDKEVSYYH